MTSVADLVRAVALRLARDQDVEAGLEDVAISAERALRAEESTSTTQRRLADRIEALDKASFVLTSLLRSIGHLRKIQSFTEEGWSAERERLGALTSTDPPAAAAAWLDYWFTAAADHRIDPLRRLIGDVNLPHGFEHLRERAADATNGLELGNWYTASPLLQAGV